MKLDTPLAVRLLDIDIHELLLQQEPFVIVERLTGFDDRHTSTETIVRPSSFFVKHGVLTPCGVMENIAQTCAVRIGYINKYILHRDIQIGVVGALQGMEIGFLPHEGDVLTTRVEVQADMQDMVLLKAVAECAGRVVTSAKVVMALVEGDGALPLSSGVTDCVMSSSPVHAEWRKELYVTEAVHHSVDAWTCTVRLCHDSLVFKVHFPSCPIMPGACIVQTAVELASRCLHSSLALVRVSSVKFLSVISPNAVSRLEYHIYNVKKEGEKLAFLCRVSAEDGVKSKMSLICKIQ